VQILDRYFLKVETPSCHASTITFYKNKPVFSWFGGLREGDPSCSIYIQYDNRIFVIGKNDSLPYWNPILFVYHDKLFLFIKVGLFCDRWSSLIYDISNIDREDFSTNKISPQIVPAGLNLSVKTKPILNNGLIYCGSSVETFLDWSSFIELWTYDEQSSSLIFVSRSSPFSIDKKIYTDPYYGKRLTQGIIQPSLWIGKNGNMNAFFRSSRGLGKIYYSYSENLMHDIWHRPIPTMFSNPNSSVDTVYMNGRLFLIYNPNEENRNPLVIHELEDEMFTIIDELVINQNIPETETTNTRELSYPYMIEYDGNLHCVYTYGRSKIEYCAISV